MSTENIALFALVASLVSILIAGRSYALAKRSFYLTKKEHDEKYQEISVYLIEAIDWNRDNVQYHSFAVSYTNKATAPNSLKEIELELECYDDAGSVYKIKVPPELSMPPVGLTGKYEELTIPLNLNARTTESGWLTFKSPLTKKNKLKVDVYRINGVTSDGTKIPVESFLHKKIIDASVKDE